MATKKETNANEATVNEELLKVEQIEETPFAALKQDKEWYLILGKYKLTQALKSKEECEEAAKDASWNRVMQVVAIVISESDEITSIKKELQELKKVLKGDRL